MIRTHRIPTRTFPRAATVIALVVVAFLAAAILSGCDLNSQARAGTHGSYNVVVYSDAETGCEYVSTGQVTTLTPRMDRDGKQICR